MEIPESFVPLFPKEEAFWEGMPREWPVLLGDNRGPPFLVCILSVSGILANATPEGRNSCAYSFRIIAAK